LQAAKTQDLLCEQIRVFAKAYDWSKGYTGAVPTNKTQVMLHQVLPDEIKPKKK
jgi:hypothetical protein